MTKRAFAVMALFVLAAAVGCGGAAADRVTGKVTFDGAPIEVGEIQFLPANGQGSFAGGPITNGEYSVECAPGEKNVVISAMKESDRPAPDGLPNYVNYIPEKYNQRTTLTADVAPGKNTLDFELMP